MTGTGGANTDPNEVKTQAEEMLSRARHLGERFEEVRRKARSITARASSDDETVTVVTNPQGALQELNLRQDAFRRAGDPERLAATIMSTQRAAQSKASAKMEKLMSDFLPDGVSLKDVTSGNFDPARLIGDVGLPGQEGSGQRDR